jgi:hypothetical protein
VEGAVNSIYQDPVSLSVRNKSRRVTHLAPSMSYLRYDTAIPLLPSLGVRSMNDLINYLVVKNTSSGKILVSYCLLSIIGWILLTVGLIAYGSLYFHYSRLGANLSDIGIVGGGILVLFWTAPRKVIGPYWDK